MIQVQFQLGVSPHTGELRAVCVTARREFIRGTIENIKDQVSQGSSTCSSKNLVHKIKNDHKY